MLCVKDAQLEAPRSQPNPVSHHFYSRIGSKRKNTQRKQSPPRSGGAIKAGFIGAVCDQEEDTLQFFALEEVEMRGFTLNNVCQCGFFTYLVFFSFVSLTTAVSFDLTELRNKVAKIKVNPRGNLWATGKNNLLCHVFWGSETY